MQYDLVFEGGGAKGMVFVGAMEEFLKEEHGRTFDRVMGTSAGAITATFLAAGYTPQEMLDALKEKGDDGKSVFTEFMGTPPILSKQEIQHSDIRAILSGINSRLIPDFIEDRLDDAIANWMGHSSRFLNLFSFVQRGGWFSADAFVVWLSRKLDEGVHARTGEPRNYSKMTLKQFYEATKTDLTVIGSDITAAQMLVLNHRTAPDLPLVYAVRMSMGIPLLWDELVWKPAWGQYRGRNMVGHAIVDGGILSNFPIELYVSDEVFVTDVMGPKQSAKILGCLIDISLSVPGAPPLEEKSGGTLSKAGNLKTVHRLQSLVTTVVEARDKVVIEAFEHLIAHCPAKGYGTTEFDMTDARRDALVEAGRETIRSYFKDTDKSIASPEGGFTPRSLGDDRSAEIAAKRARSILGP